MSDVASLSDAELTALYRQRVTSRAASDMSDDELKAAYNARNPSTGSVAADVAKSGGIGLVKGAIQTAGLPGEVGNLASAATSAIGSKLGASPETVDAIKGGARAAAKFIPGMGAFTGPGPAEIQRHVEGQTGEFYKPKTTAGEYAQTAGEFLPAAALGPGGVARKVGMQALAPAMASEAAGQYTKGTDWEPYARVGGALAAPAALGAAGIAAAPITSRIAPQWFTDQKLAQVLRRSGQSADDVSAALTSAAGDAQPMFTAADALGNAGQRALSGVTRQPHDMRQQVVDMLDTRQAGQGRRISNSLSEAFDAPDTAAQRTARLLSERGTAAETNYGAARASASPVDVTPAIQKADAFLGPANAATFKPGSGISDTSIASVVAKAKAFLTDGKAQVSDFKGAFDAKKEIDNLIEGASKTQQRELIPIQKALDNALTSASKPYANARDTFSKQSKAIDAVDTGKDAAMRGRFEDTIPAFQGMAPETQSAFRAGYSDPLIAGTQSAAFGVNKARPLINDATAAEFPAFAVPGRADQLARRLGREQTMFETRNQALGGSRTADNLADASDTTKLDPGAIAALLRGNIGQASSGMVNKALSELQGMSPGVAERMARILIENDPAKFGAAAQRALSASGGAPLLARQLVRGTIASDATSRH